MNLFAEMLHSVYDLKSYVGFRKNGTGRTFLYGVLLNLIYMAAVVVIPIAFSVLSAGGVRSFVRNAVPDFVLENGRLQAEEELVYADLMMYFCLDTSRPVTEEITKSDLLAFDSAVVIDAEHIMIKAEGGILKRPLSDLNIPYLDREMLLEGLLPMVYAGGATLAVLFLWIMGLLYFGGALLTAVIGIWIASRMRYRISFGDLYKLAVHARTAPLVLDVVYTLAPVYIPIFNGITLVLSAFYMRGAIRELKFQEDQSKNL